MNNQQIRQLISHPVSSHFHQLFEKNFRISPRIRVEFSNDELLWQIRKTYLYEYLANDSLSKTEKIELYQHGLTLLQTQLAPRSLPPAHLLFICHYTAKLNYQLGTLWMNVDSYIEAQALDSAKNYFESALSSYDSFKRHLNIRSEQDFCNLSYQLMASTIQLDAYSPWARTISCAYNHYCCCEEDINYEGDLNPLLLDLEKKITFAQDKKGSISYTAIQEVQLKIQQIKLSNPSTYTSSESLTTESSPSTPVNTIAKRKKTSKKTYQSIALVAWSPSILSMAQLQSNVQKSSWSIPDFLRERQKLDMQEIQRGFQGYTKPLLVTKPTGTGKTAEFTALTSNAYRHGLCTIIVVPTVTLVMQTKQKLIEYKERNTDMHYEISDIAIYSPTKNHREIKPITIITMASFINQTKQALKQFPEPGMMQHYLTNKSQAYFKHSVFFHPDFFSLLIIDEGHHVDGNEFYKIITHEQCKRPKILFSASTVPGEYPKLDRICEPVVTQTLKEGILSGELSPLQMLTLDFSMYPQARELSRSIRQKINNADTVNIEEDVGKLLHDNIGFSYTAAGIIKQIYEKVPGSRKLMVFTDSIDHANLLAKILCVFFKQNVGAFHTQNNHRDEILARFRSTPKSIIVAVGALDEGFDDPDINLILDFSLYVKRSRRLIQRIGRAERIRDDNSSAIILNINVLSNDLQLIPRDVIMGRGQEHSYLGLREDQIITEHLVELTLPPPLFIEHEVQGMRISKAIHPQPAKIMFPQNQTKHKIGTPPVEEEQMEYSGRFFTSSSSIGVNANISQEDFDECLSYLSNLV